ncbi:shikimate dehydrogenase [Pseudomonas psychrophila]|jgi:shikimate dehydrogenase|uniref:Shikimate dehydrogenase (NADP(+)) n=1 Tax=Pseudomonas psychrophila TaxID=122355 RepID=A0A8I1K8A8_9PSED|nr:shikimate dehydrogenase [Pseudomonas psychrophila]EPJ91834.1 shikimate/quinate 5-dehydrogenase [Pseudomonas psychrophila]KAB0491686.1 shikimate dehydrogenase [Pseudomonas psychrophila]KMN00794.1 ribonuclease BN [Pseudomonas psychrophila]MBJ2257491.1 shikimate dehydrogenase [Pseudomonas psychrophila]QIE33946.1 shikimate dehydrogenase [Pseudomonas psychrophila]
MPQSLPTLCGSIMGSPFSLSAKIHNAAYAALGLDYTFVCFGVEDPVAAVAAIRALGIRGMNVSMPYKTAVMAHLDVIDESAHVIGAVNTINNIDGVLTGYNTDYLGAVRALQEVSELNNRRIAVIGAGGAARAVVYGCLQAAARVTVFNRSRERGKALTEDLGARWGGSVDAFAAQDFDIVINATSVGFKQPDSNPLDGLLASHLIVMDVAFMPVQTALLLQAAALGCRTVSGTRMLVHQACRQIELYTEHDAPIDVMEQAMLHEIQRLKL